MGLKLFYEIVDEIYKNNEIKFSKKLKWKKLKKHKDYLNDLLIIRNKSELKRKILINNPFKQGPWVKKKNKLNEIKLRTKLKYFYPNEYSWYISFFHDSSSSIVKDGIILSASQEERYSRVKYDKSFPIESIKFNLKYNNLNIDDIDAIVFFENPKLKLDRIISNTINYFPKTLKQFYDNIDDWIYYKLNIKKTIKELLKNNNLNYEKDIFICEHHLSHAASSFYPSPFKNAALLVMDAVGEYATSSIHIGEENKIFPIKQENFPNSIGMLYSAFTYYLGFKVNSGEYKMMGLSPYGEPKYYNKIRDSIVEINSDGSIKLNLDFFSFHQNNEIINKDFENFFGIKIRNKNEDLNEFHMDIAASVQKITEDIIIKKILYTKKITNKKTYVYQVV